MYDHLKLKIWQRAHALSLRLDGALKGRARIGPPGLASQLSRACASIAANIAESSGQNSPSQSARFLDMSNGSSTETENHLARASGTGLLRAELADEMSQELREIRRMTIKFRMWVLKQPPPSEQPKD
ncbi:MAG: four helix bundle protein [Phycisphaerae bacterium]|nr:four helix bundle protein [Gemmatimonadaceae bacterium]